MLSDQEETGPFPEELPQHPAGSRGRVGASARFIPRSPSFSISIGLQYGVPLKALVNKLTNTRFEPSGFTENPSIRYTSSVLDYIARWLGGRFLSSDYLKPGAASSEDMIHPPISSPALNAGNHKPIQPGSGGGTTGMPPSRSTCGMLMVLNGSCYKCVNCGSTSGCS